MNHTDLSQSTFDNKPKFKLGVVVNPFAGIGGALALKGSDGAEIREKALVMGAEKKANEKMAKALSILEALSGQFTVVTASGDMGETICESLGIPYAVSYTHLTLPTICSV